MEANQLHRTLTRGFPDTVDGLDLSRIPANGTVGIDITLELLQWVGNCSLLLRLWRRRRMGTGALYRAHHVVELTVDALILLGVPRVVVPALLEVKKQNAFDVELVNHAQDLWKLDAQVRLVAVCLCACMLPKSTQRDCGWAM
eukprot:3760505-Amphidinium_carterae.2